MITPGAAYNEVVIALLDRPGSRRGLIRFMGILMAFQWVLMLVFTLTPLAFLWFWKAAALAEPEARLAAHAFFLLIPGSLISPLNSWFVGNILHNRKSRAITEGMLLYLAVFVLGLIVGSRFHQLGGIFIILGSSTLAGIVQTVWLGLRSRIPHSIEILTAKEHPA
jgi:hypothetical protein